MKDTPKPAKRRKYDAAFRAEGATQSSIDFLTLRF